jgi:hypothetical protein
MQLWVGQYSMHLVGQIYMQFNTMMSLPLEHHLRLRLGLTNL